MSEERDSRTATVGKKRAFNNTPVYDLLTSSDSSDGEPAHKRLKQTSKVPPGRGSPPSRSVDTGEQKEYISLLDSDDSDFEEYASAEPGNESEFEIADNAAALDAPKPSQSQLNADSIPSGKSTSSANVQSHDDSADDEFVSAEAGSTKEDIPAIQGSADAVVATPNQDLKDTNMLAETGGLSRDDEATRTSATGIDIVRQPGAADRVAIAEGRRIQIQNLPNKSTLNEVLMLFKGYEIDSIYMPLDFRTKKTRKTAFVCLASSADTKEAIASLNHANIRGTKVHLTLNQGMISSAANAENTEAAGDSAAGPKLSKKEAALQRNYGDEYIVALHTAVAEHIANPDRPVYPIPLSPERFSFKLGNDSVRHPEMLENDKPIPLSELCVPKFIPLLLRANSSQAALFLMKPHYVYEAFVMCVEIRYRAAFSRHRRAAKNEAQEYSNDYIATQVCRLMASLMPEVFENFAKSSKYRHYPAEVKKAILDTLEEQQLLGQERDAIKARFASVATKKNQKKKAVRDSKNAAPDQELVVVADTKLPKIDPDAKLGSAELPLRYVSEMEEEGNIVQDAVSECDMNIQSEVQSDNDAEDLELQMRYFPPSEHSSGSRCLSCGSHDHSTSNCPPVICKSCGQLEMHYNWACPEEVRCPRCREQGHTVSDCPEKLKRSRGEGMKCETCNSLDHIERNCDHLWRTYVAPTTARKVADLLISCFSCGSSTHFGMDCDLRLKGRERASSTFSILEAQRYIDPNSKFRSLSGIKDYTIKSKNKPKEFSIKGRAKQNPINLDTDSDDGDFLRPPVKKTQPGNGHIQINRNGNFDRFQNPLQPVVQDFTRDPVPQTYQPQYTHGRGRISPVYHDYREEEGRPYSGDHYNPQQRYYGGQHYEPSIDRYEGRFSAPYDRDIGVPRGGGMSRGGSAPRGESRGGKASQKRKLFAKRGAFRGRGS